MFNGGMLSSITCLIYSYNSKHICGSVHVCLGDYSALFLSKPMFMSDLGFWLKIQQ